MLERNAPNIDDEGLNFAFDFRGYFYKLINYWKLILLCIILGLLAAYLINVRKQNVYALHSLISVESNKSPFSTASTSISFNWGGVSGKVGQVITTLKTRTHNEKVVDSLMFYIEYLAEGEYQKIDIYKKAPFEFLPNSNAPQLINKALGIRVLDDDYFELFTAFEEESGKGQLYDTKSLVPIYNLPEGPFNKRYRFNETINLPFINGVIRKREQRTLKPSSTYYLQFKNFDQVVNEYQNSIKVDVFEGSTSVIRIRLAGTNKSKIVDYLNATAAILSETDLKRQNQYATNTIKFIDSSLTTVDLNIKDVSQEMDDFRRKNQVFDIEEDIQKISNNLQSFEQEKEAIKLKLNYLNSLEDYLKTQTDYSGIAAPTSVGIAEGNIMNSVSKIIALSTERKAKEFTTRESSSIFKNIDRQIDAERNVLLATISSTKQTYRAQLETLQDNIANLKGKLSDLPNEQQEFLKIERQLSVSQAAYDLYIAKRSEAAIAKAANVSDILVVDDAKDIGGGRIGPDKSLNYMIGLLGGAFVPVLLLFMVYFLDNTIHAPDEVKRLSSIPILGIIGKYKHPNNLVVFEKPKSAVAESFRAIRSSLQFTLKNDASKRGQTILITSSVGGEGKTYCSINLASIYASSGKKTVLVGLDLRKPKIFGDFGLTNKTGVVNYLIEEHDLDAICNTTQVNNLDVITSGPIPPNPSELLISKRMDDLMEILKTNYDIVILDTPPLGVVTDALDLTKYADTNIFMLRLNYTKKGMLRFINNKFKTKEIKNLNFVLNFYKPRSNEHYGYGYGYGYGVYGHKYHDGAKKKAGVLKRIKHLFKQNA